MKSNKLNPLYVMRKVGSKACDPVRGIDPKFKLTAKQAVNLFKKNNGLCGYSDKEYSNGGDLSFERINPLEVYTPENTILCKKDINSIKGSTLDNFLHSELLTDETKLRVLEMVTKKFKAYLKNKAEKIKGTGDGEE